MPIIYILYICLFIDTFSKVHIQVIGPLTDVPLFGQCLCHFAKEAQADLTRQTKIR